MIESHWQTAIHESAHVISAYALGGRCIRVVVHHDGSGMTWPDGLNDTDLAILAAAGLEADRLLSDVPMPATLADSIERTESALTTCDATGLTTAEKLEFIAARYPPDAERSDARRVADYCTAGGYADQPERWVSRYYFVHGTAAKIVCERRDKIVKVATALFDRSVLDERQIMELIQ